MTTYVDSSVLLARLLAEDRRPPARLFDRDLTSSRLAQYEVWTQINQRRPTGTLPERVTTLLARLDWLDLSPAVLARALDPFPVPVRTLDALHLASVEFLRSRGQSVLLATYDARLARGAAALGIEIFDL